MPQPALRFSANISMLFCERPFTDRIHAAASIGFDAVECHFPYEHDAADIRVRLQDAGVVMNGLNTPPGQTGEFGLAALPGREDDFARALDAAVAWGAQAGVETIHCMAGCISDEERDRASDVFLRNLENAIPAARDAGLTLLIEPINTRDRPGYFLRHPDQARDVVTKLASERVRLMFDFYHMQIIAGDLLTRMDAFWPIIGHFQIASAPHRREPDEGEVNYSEILKAIAAKGWPGYVAAEYNPRGRTEDGLDWLKLARASVRPALRS
jgi:hydroxypyruvate isomerase